MRTYFKLIIVSWVCLSGCEPDYLENRVDIIDMKQLERKATQSHCEEDFFLYSDLSLQAEGHPQVYFLATGERCDVGIE